ncbi:juvenile hormone esterase [Lutzomyia longipalpis]|uniref:juvenile hormone esterase n=1 Tax=Lutzomyia longipalpis TaxID=7200 RepID=UPI0024835E16|nr:juvenile hormone esterase [Lutzomyia longipalpis]XP_055677255.1 juvenile hormone esterase [Lutzomyia longipalpis]
MISRSVFVLILWIFSVLNHVHGRTSDELKVKLSHGGVVVGRHMVSHDGKGIRAFMGIPYAEPPVGSRRFRAPVPKEKWSGERLAVKDSDICIQRDPYRRDMEISGSEDCLYLNVYTPEGPLDEALPVMVFFHGGGWQCGSGVSYFYGPDFLMEHRIIYVAANFRLGPLGFLSTGNMDCPGNFGLKDQVMVLQWIRDNIANFGGNRDSVTVFGESAGGASGTYMMMSPMAKGLFHRVISQSGTNLCAWAQPAHPGVAEKRAERLGQMMGCTDANHLIECLREKSAEDITAAFYDFFEWDTDPMIPFIPVVEPQHPEAFITKHPREEFDPHGLSLPWLSGVTLDEGALKTASLINVPELTQSLNANWDYALPISLNYDHLSQERQKEITSAINEFYFRNRKLTPETSQNLTNLYSDAWFVVGFDEYLRIRLTKGDRKKLGPTFVYLFAHKGSASFTEIFKGGRESYYGACHAEELQYLFPIGKELFVSAIPTKNDIKMRKLITKLWVNFARTGHPTPKDGDLSFEWKEAKGYPVDYLRLGRMDNEDKPLAIMEKGLFEERINFWRKLSAHCSNGQENLIRDEL